MRGGFIHNTILVTPVAEYFRNLGATVQEEFIVRCSHGLRAVDLFIEHQDHRIVCEAELAARRIAADFEKAALLAATWLLIVTPTAQVAWRIERVVRQSRLRLPNGQYVIEPLGPALPLIRQCFPLISDPIRPRTTNPNLP